MKLLLFVVFSFIIVNIVYCRTIGQSLDAGIAHAREDAEEVGRVITEPFRYVGEKARNAVASTRHVAGDVFEGAAQKLHYAGQQIRGDDDRNDAPSNDNASSSNNASSNNSDNKNNNNNNDQRPNNNNDRVNNAQSPNNNNNNGRVDK